MKSMCMFILVLGLMGSMAHAALSVTVPSDYPTIQAAVNAVDAGGTVTITNSGIYTENLVINKSVKIFAAVGQTPVLRNTNTTSTASIWFLNDGDAQLGSLTGGRIKLELIKATAVAGSVYNPVMMVRMHQTTGSLVTLENLDLLETGTTSVNQMTPILHDINRKSTVTMRYVDINVNRTVLTGGGAYGIVIGDTTAVINNTTQGGPTYNLDHVRIKGYTRAGVWNHFKDAEINLNYVETGTLGERQGTINYPWSGFINNNAPARMVGRFTNTIMRGPATSDACAIQTNGSSVTLSRSVFLNSYNITATGVAGALRLGGTTGVPNPGVMTVVADHCDFVDLGSVGSNAGAIVRTAAATENLTTASLTVTNSNIYSSGNKAVNLLTFRAGIDSFASSNNNVYGVGTNVGYTAGAGDISYDPLYFDAASGDMRYSNNTLKTADSAGGPVGTNASYVDVYGAGIIPGEAGVINRAHGWTTLK